MTTKDDDGAAYDDGGAAFPMLDDNGLRHAGMSLRDYFAAKAMQGYMATCGEGAYPDGISSADCVADFAYRIADAMLAERSK